MIKKTLSYVETTHIMKTLLSIVAILLMILLTTCTKGPLCVGDIDINVELISDDTTAMATISRCSYKNLKDGSPIRVSRETPLGKNPGKWHESTSQFFTVGDTTYTEENGTLVEARWALLIRL